MKITPTKVEYVKEYETQYGKLHLFNVHYNNMHGYYSSKNKDQKYIVVGKEVEVTEELQEGKNGPYMKIRLIRSKSQSNYGRNLKKEQSRYSGFAVSYVKDLIIADKLAIKDLESASKKIFNLMVELDKTLES